MQAPECAYRGRCRSRPGNGAAIVTLAVVRAAVLAASVAALTVVTSRVAATAVAEALASFDNVNAPSIFDVPCEQTCNSFGIVWARNMSTELRPHIAHHEFKDFI